MRRLFKWLVILGVLAGLAALVVMPVMAWWKQRSIVKYMTANVTRGRVETMVNSTGTVKPIRSVSVGAFTSGLIDKIFVDFNSEVTEGQLLAVIDPRLLQAAYDRDKAAVDVQIAERDRVQALLNQAIANEKRARKLRDVNTDYISETEWDQYIYSRLTLEAQLKLANANIIQARANLKNAEANLGYTKILSPVSGVVIERKVDPGQTVVASFQTQELFIVAPDMQTMHVFASVDEADIGLIRTAQAQGKSVNFTVDAYPGELFPGKIYQIRKNSTTTQNVVTYPVVVEAKNPEQKLFPGMTANISFQIDAKENVLRIPAAALRFVPLPAQVRLEDRHYVEAVPSSPQEGAPQKTAAEKVELSRNRQNRTLWVQDGLFLRAVPVTLGFIENQYAELVKGELTEGDALVTGIDNALPPR